MIMNKWNEGGTDMSQSILQMEKDFFDYNKKISAYNEALALIYWDLRTGAPKQGINQRAEVIGVLSSEVYDLSVSETMAAYLATLSSKEAQPVISDITKELFVNLYPFLPTHFDILLHLLGALAKSTGGIGLRSAIKVIQDICIFVSRFSNCSSILSVTTYSEISDFKNFS